ncbi:peptidylprolyl isomerase [Candidatus Avoscillospira sp. LCP25S3_F1]|uniref:peptidylprolyl isomerase n=1 Tax=Candidatus Avoscillospira sp. LCP25S3_F1 TaxID=3438825 RepID=UPI003F905972
MKTFSDKLKTLPHKRVIAATLATVVVLGAALALWPGRHEAGEGATAGAMDQAVVVCGDWSMDNTTLNYYYWSEYFYLVGSAGENLPESLDPTQPLDEQQYDEDRTWQDYLLDQTMITIRDTMSMVFAAEEAGFTMGDTYAASMETVVDGLAADAESRGYDGVTAYLQASYGPGATEESFRAYLTDTYLAAAYTDELYNRPQFTEEEIAAYCTLHQADYARLNENGGETRLQNAYVLLCKPAGNTEEAWDEAETAARTLYATWQAESGAEADFATLADSHSATPGLRQDVSPSDCSGELADWLFDPERSPGDTAVLRSDEGWNVVYALEPSERTVWQKQAQQDLRKETYETEARTIREQYEFLIDRDAVTLVTPQALTPSDG